MEMNEYQKKAAETAIYPNAGLNTFNGVSYCTLKLNGEAGEIAEHVGKAIRDDGGVITLARQEKLFHELGDVLWYVANLAKELGYDLQSVAEGNLSKLADRKARNVLHGSGSDR